MGAPAAAQEKARGLLEAFAELRALQRWQTLSPLHRAVGVMQTP